MASSFGHLKMFRPARRGFTLVELLVVIGIIAVLIGILIPVLGRARDSARQVTCMSQIKQAGLYILSYVNTTNGRFPPLWATAPAAPVSSEWNNWISIVITPKVYTQSGVQVPPTFMTRQQIFRCPSFVPDTGNELTERTYVINISEAGNDPYPWMGLPGMKMNQVKGASKKAMLFDIWYTVPNTSLPLFKVDTVVWSAYYDSIIPFNSKDFRKAPHSTRNERATNVAFLDGHVERVRYVGSTLPIEIMYPDK